jgi:hypothetical protein
MSEIREQNNPLIMKLLREHDSLGLDQVTERKELQRRILFLMTTIKMHELEQARAVEKKKIGGIANRNFTAFAIV